MNVPVFAPGFWDADAFFERLADKNKLCRSLGFKFARVSGLKGFEDAVATMQDAANFVCVDVTSDSVMRFDNTPARRMTKTIFLYMAHEPWDMKARAQCLRIMDRIFRQFMSVLIRFRTRLSQQLVCLDSRIPYYEMDQYIFSGGAAVWFQVSADLCSNLVFDIDDWIDDPTEF